MGALSLPFWSFMGEQVQFGLPCSIGKIFWLVRKGKRFGKQDTLFILDSVKG